MNHFLDELRKCGDCRRFSSHIEDVLKFQPKASIQFNAYDCWKPDKVETLFIAEAPPWDEPKYFYNTHIKAGALRRGLFDRLGIKDYGEHGLNTFKQRYFLIDTIKCRLKKRGSNPPEAIIRNCARRFLLREIVSLMPERIVLLGNTAKRGLEQFPEFADLEKYKVTRYCGKVVKTEKHAVVLYVFPSTRNLRTMRKHPLLEVIATGALSPQTFKQKSG